MSFTLRSPAWLHRAIEWLREPSRKWFRLPVAVLLIVGGFAGFLPILGFWMIPLGLFLLGEDIPIVRRWTNAVVARVRAWRDRRSERSRSPR